MDIEGETSFDDLDDDEKREFAERLALAYNSKLSLAADFYNCILFWSAELANGNVLGKRTEVMSSIHNRMEMILAMSLPAFGLDEEQMKTDSQFEDIISQLDDPDD